MFEFRNPSAFLLLLSLPLLLRPLLSVSTAIPVATPVFVNELPQSIRSRLRRPTLLILRTLCLIGIIIALARPQSVSSVTETQASGRDIMLTLDISGSMEALDFFIDGKRVDRLNALKQVTTEFIKGRAGDRMGLVVFSDNAFTQCPLTLDHNVLISFVNRLEVGMAGRGTAIGDALAITLKRLKEIESESKVIVLVTDGKNTSGTLSTKEAAILAKKHGVKIHILGIGGNEPAPMPIVTALGTKRYVSQQMEYDEPALEEMAKITSGKYFNAKNMEKLKEVYSEINKLERRDDKALEYFQYEEHYKIFTIFSLMLLFVELTLSSTIFLKVP